MRDAAIPFIAGRLRSDYVSRSVPRLLSSLLLALAVILSPLAMIGGAGPAHAAMPQTASTAAHGGEEGAAQEHEKRAPGMELGCAIACAAVPATGPFSAERLQHAAMPPTLTGDQLLSGIRPEGETPPPRIRPEI